jgi:hypothetical protein
VIDAGATDVQNPRVATPLRRLLAVTTCDPGALPTLTAGTLIVGTDQPGDAFAAATDDDATLALPDSRIDALEQQWLASAGAASELR